MKPPLKYIMKDKPKFNDRIDQDLNVDSPEDEQLSKQKEAPMMTQYLRDQGKTEVFKEGIIEGMRLGRNKGRKEEAVVLVYLQLSRKFYLPKTEITSKLDRLTLENLRELAMEIFNFTDSDSVDRWINLKIMKNHNETNTS